MTHLTITVSVSEVHSISGFILIFIAPILILIVQNDRMPTLERIPIKDIDAVVLDRVHRWTAGLRGRSDRVLAIGAILICLCALFVLVVDYGLHAQEGIVEVLGIGGIRWVDGRNVGG